MRLPRVRFTVRRMMVAVAVIAVLIEGVSLWQKAAIYRWKVRHHAMMERSSVIAVVEGTNTASRAGVGPVKRGLVRVPCCHEA